MSRLTTFVAPRPNALVAGAMTWVNRVVMLKGVAGLRDLAPLNRLAGIRGVCNIRQFDFPEADRALLAGACGPGKATFVTPNHPEFFTDWMIDKEIASRVCPKAAFWATHSVVNGFGGTVQRFWLANNLVAQIPGNSEAARDHSVEWALMGNTVLLHPEGSVGWHSNVIGPLMPGAFEMAFEALRRGRERAPGLEVWIAPVVWKLVFARDVEPELHRECAYVERRLGIDSPVGGISLPQRIYTIYETLLHRDELRLGLAVSRDDAYARRHATVVGSLVERLRHMLSLESDDPYGLLRLARRSLRESASSADQSSELKLWSEMLTRVMRVGSFAFAPERIGLEELAEHLKRLRNDYCRGSLRDTMNRFVPQPVGPRVAHIRVPEPIAVHLLRRDVAGLLEQTRARMQAALDAINAARAGEASRRYPNPFFDG